MAAVTISILERNTSQITLAWDPQDQSTIVSFKLYVSLTDVTANYQVAQINIPNVPAAYGFGHNLVTTVLTLAQVQALSGMSAAVFGITPLYFRATTVDTSVAESAIASSPSRPYDFDRTGPSGRIGTLYGAQLVSANPLYDDNYTVSRTMVAPFNVVNDIQL